MLWLLAKRYKTDEIEKLKAACDKAQIDFKHYEIEELAVEVTSNSIEFYYQGELISKPTKCLIYYGCATTIEHLGFAQLLTASGVEVINDVQEALILANKFVFNAIHAPAMPVIDTYKLSYKWNDQEVAMITDKLGYPLVLKADIGSFGAGIYKIQTPQELKNIVEQIRLIRPDYYFNLQKFIEYDQDLRIFNINGQLYGMERKNPVSFKANFTNSEHTQLKKIEINSQIKQICNQIQSKYQSKIWGLDLLVKDGNYIICELNSSPGFKGISQVHNLNIADEIIKELYGNK